MSHAIYNEYLVNNSHRTADLRNEYCNKNNYFCHTERSRSVTFSNTGHRSSFDYIHRSG